MRRTVLAAVVALAAASTIALPSSVGAANSYAPIDRPGPALRPSPAALAAAVTCSGDFHNGKEPVLLVPGTAFTYKTQFAWSWAPALSRAGIPWCAVSPPYSQLGDLTIAGEYDVYAIRHAYHLAGNRKIAVVGHSQGGMQPRWALRFWPDTRAMVADYVGVAPDSQGVSLNAPALTPTLLPAVCSVTGCPQGIWQQIRGSHFIQAINSIQQTFPGIDYSIIYSRLDGLVDPIDTPLEVTPGVDYRRVAIQDICPIRVADHLTNGTVDAATWALIINAITHHGPVDPARINRTVCSQLFLPGLNYADALAGGVNAPLQIARAAAAAPYEKGENPLPAYVY